MFVFNLGRDIDQLECYRLISNRMLCNSVVCCLPFMLLMQVIGVRVHATVL